eukprot:TRINITY_DN5075_c0_g1_i1.p1 TRINITY_DN5075_c0_g1~~TRINITY_DN5075_c0_g1_i1.p1  ORF type:complete len:598 (+),score=116.77 TRINITY_DN5075_c0_g1_i1:267-1796(+)
MAFNDQGLVTWQQFLLMFAMAKERQRESDNTIQNLGKLEVLGAYLLKKFAKTQTANSLKKEIARVQGDVKKLNKSKQQKRTPSIHEPEREGYDDEEEALSSSVPLLETNSPSRMSPKRQSATFPDEDPSRIYMMSRTDKRDLDIVRWVFVLCAGLLGSIYASTTGVIDWRLQRMLDYNGSLFDPIQNWSHFFIYWAALLGGVIFFSIVEIIFLFWGGLHASAVISYMLGIEAWLVGYVPGSEHTITAMVRAALDVPNPSSVYMGIQPLKDSSKSGVLFKTILWKAKTAITTIVLKQVFFRVLSRSLLPFLAIPVCAVWNMMIAWKVIHDVISICLGNIIVPQLVQKFVLQSNLEEESLQMTYHVVGTAIVLSGEVHPNHEALLKSLVSLLGPVPEGRQLDDKEVFKQKMMQLRNREDRLVLLQMFAVTLATNSNVSFKSMRYLRDLAWVLDLNPDFSGVDRLHNALNSSRAINIRDISVLFRYTDEGEHQRRFIQLKMLWRTFVYNIAF